MKNHLPKRSNRSATIVVFILSACFGLILHPVPVFSQGKVAQRIAELKENGFFKKEELKMFSVATLSNPEISKALSRYTSLKVNNELYKILDTKPEYLKLSIPLENGSANVTVLMYKVNISPNGLAS